MKSKERLTYQVEYRGKKMWMSRETNDVILNRLAYYEDREEAIATDKAIVGAGPPQHVCPKCGYFTGIKPGDFYCWKCGKKLKGERG